MTKEYIPELTSFFWKKSLLDPNSYSTFIETGSYQGDTIYHLKKKFKQIHSIEITDKWYNYCVNKFKNYPHIHLHLGDSIVKLPEILSNINEKAIIFLDAHYSGGTTGKPDNNSDSSLLEELAYLKTREYDDIIIIDDTRFFGAIGGENDTNPEDDSIMWHKFKYNWGNITQDKVLSLIKPNYQVVTNSENLYTITPRKDQIIAYPQIETNLINRKSKGFSHKLYKSKVK